MERASYVYILASAPYGTLYIGATTNLIKRVWEHREQIVDGFTKSYGVHRLVWYEVHTDVMEAAAQERKLKKFNRAWKISMISKFNPTWRDLFPEIC